MYRWRKSQPGRVRRRAGDSGGAEKSRQGADAEGLIRGIESVRDFDIGLVTELKLDYSAKDHKGFDHLIPTVIRGSRAVPFADRLVAAPHRSQIKRKCQRIADSA